MTKYKVTETKRPDGRVDLEIDMSEDVEAHLKHRVGQEKKHPECPHCVEALKVYEIIGI